MKIAIVSGGHIDLEYLREEFTREQFDYVIAADSGLVSLDLIQTVPDVMLGDFDSVCSSVFDRFKKMQIPTYTYPSRKDYTDTELAMRCGMERLMNSGENGVLIMYGATGTRLDHMLANISLLKAAAQAGVLLELRDAHNRVRLIQERIYLRRDEVFGDNVSLLPLSERVEDVCLKGFRYPLMHGCLSQGSSLGVSNVLEEAVGEISVGKGDLLVIESRD